MDKNIIRCSWLTEDPIYIKYHDTEWGEPQYDDIKLFEMLCLEGQQAGLSWITILRKRDNYRKHFHNFDPLKISQMDNMEIQQLLSNSDIVRHKGKIESIINNAKCYITMQKNGEEFSQFVWNFVDQKPIINNWKTNKEIPTQTDISVEMSKDLKKRGYKFVGSTICYAFMQACGLVNDHIVDCFCRS